MFLCKHTSQLAGPEPRQLGTIKNSLSGGLFAGGTPRPFETFLRGGVIFVARVVFGGRVIFVWRVIFVGGLIFAGRLIFMGV